MLEERKRRENGSPPYPPEGELRPPHHTEHRWPGEPGMGVGRGEWKKMTRQGETSSGEMGLPFWLGVNERKSLQNSVCVCGEREKKREKLEKMGKSTTGTTGPGQHDRKRGSTQHTGCVPRERVKEQRMMMKI